MDFTGHGLIDHFRLMARNNRWANQRLIVACVALGPEEFVAPRTSFFPSLSATLSHVLLVDRYYIDALEAGGLGQRVRDEVPVFTDPEALRRAQDVSDLRLIAFCDALTPDRLDATALTDRGAEGMVPERVSWLLPHLFQHQIHHRGQAHAMLAGTAVAPPQLDEFFLDYDRDPAAARLLAL